MACPLTPISAKTGKLRIRNSVRIPYGLVLGQVKKDPGYVHLQAAFSSGRAPREMRSFCRRFQLHRLVRDSHEWITIAQAREKLSVVSLLPSIGHYAAQWGFKLVTNISAVDAGSTQGERP
jgi:hypothetical protein